MLIILYSCSRGLLAQLFLAVAAPRCSCSELEGNACHFLVLLLGELVFERGQEFGVNLESEALDFLHDWLEMFICVA